MPISNKEDWIIYNTKHKKFWCGGPSRGRVDEVDANPNRLFIIINFKNSCLELWSIDARDARGYKKVNAIQRTDTIDGDITIMRSCAKTISRRGDVIN